MFIMHFFCLRHKGTTIQSLHKGYLSLIPHKNIEDTFCYACNPRKLQKTTFTIEFTYQFFIVTFLSTKSLILPLNKPYIHFISGRTHVTNNLFLHSII